MSLPPPLIPPEFVKCTLTIVMTNPQNKTFKSHPFHIVRYYTKWGKTSWAYSTIDYISVSYFEALGQTINCLLFIFVFLVSLGEPIIHDVQLSLLVFSLPRPSSDPIDNTPLFNTHHPQSSDSFYHFTYIGINFLLSHTWNIFTILSAEDLTF